MYVVLISKVLAGDIDFHGEEYHYQAAKPQMSTVISCRSEGGLTDSASELTEGGGVTKTD